MKQLILTLTMDKGRYEEAKNHYEEITSSIGDAAIFLLDTYAEMSEPRRKEHTDMYAIYINGRKPETEEERRQLEKEEASGKVLKIHDDFINNDNDWYIPNDPLKHCYSKIDVVKNGKPVLSIDKFESEIDISMLSVYVTVNGKKYAIYQEVGFTENHEMFQIHLEDEHSSDYWTSVEDVEANHIYELNNESVPGIDDTLWYAIVNKIVPNYGWSNEDITAVLP